MRKIKKEVNDLNIESLRLNLKLEKEERRKNV